jgi:hypothetical protein
LIDRRALHIAYDRKHAKSTTKKRVTLQEKETALRRKIGRWLPLQAVYMPHVAALRQSKALTAPAAASAAVSRQRGVANKVQDEIDSDNDGREGLNGDDDDADRSSGPPLIALVGDVQAWDIDLMLPSSLSPELLAKTSQSLIQKELRLRIGEMEATLAQLRHLLAVKTGVYLDKKASSRGQREGTRSAELLTSYQGAIKRCAELYRVLRGYAKKLDPAGTYNEWLGRFQELKDQDVREAKEGHADEEDAPVRKKKRGKKRDHRTMALGEGHREMSWIWKMSRVTSDGTREDVVEESEIPIGKPSCYTLYYSII